MTEMKSRTKKSYNIDLTNRNILPNMTNVILSYMRRVNRSGGAVLKMMESLGV